MTTLRKRGADAIRDLAAAAEHRANVRKGQVELALKAIPAVALGYGLVSAFEYFYLGIHFFPSGLSVGDNLLFIFITLAYGLLVFGVGAFGLGALAPALVGESWTRNPVPSKGNGPRRGAVALRVFMGLIWVAGAAWIISWRYNHLGKAFDFDLSMRWHAACSFVAMAVLCYPYGRWSAGMTWDDRISQWLDWFLMSLFHTLFVLFSSWLIAFNPDQGLYVVAWSVATGAMWWGALNLHLGRMPASGAGHRGTPSAVWTFAALPLTLPLLFDFAYLHGTMSHTVMGKLGLSAGNVSVQLKGDALVLARAKAAMNPGRVTFCEEADGSALVGPVDLLWHGMGTRSLVSLGTPRAGWDASEEDRFEVSSSELKLAFQGDRQCQDLRSDVYFALGQLRHPEAQMTQLIDELRQTLIARQKASTPKAHWSLERVLVQGHADPLPYGEQGNEGLSLARAQVATEALKTGLEAELKAQRGRVQWQTESLGSRYPGTRPCADVHGRQEQAECHAPDRRVHVRLVFTCQDEKDEPSTRCTLKPPSAGA